MHKKKKDWWKYVETSPLYFLTVNKSVRRSLTIRSATNTMWSVLRVLRSSSAMGNLVMWSVLYTLKTWTVMIQCFDRLICDECFDNIYMSILIIWTAMSTLIILQVQMCSIVMSHKIKILYKYTHTHTLTQQQEEMLSYCSTNFRLGYTHTHTHTHTTTVQINSELSETGRDILKVRTFWPVLTSSVVCSMVKNWL